MGLAIMSRGPEEKTDDVSKRIPLDARLVEKLCCPACKADLKNEKELALLCISCHRKYPIEAGIPNLVCYTEEGEVPRSFDKLQAKYERELHDYQALHDYEDRVVRVYGDKTELIASRWANALKGPLLDYGCGTGQLSRVFKRCHSPVYAFDISSASVAKNVRDNNVLAVTANAFHLPFKDRSFETVCCNGVLHHTLDLRSAISEMARVADKCIAISEPATPRHNRTPWRTLRSPIELARAIVRAILLRAFGVYEGLRGRRQILRPPNSQKAASKYERPLEPQQIIEPLADARFRLTMLRFWTNVSWRRRSSVKKLLTRMSVSSKVGSHFEVRFERCDEPAAAP